MPKYEVICFWSVKGSYFIEAVSKEEAIRKARKEASYPDDWEWDGTLEIADALEWPE